MTETDPVVVQAKRTPFGKEDGVFADVRSEDLSAAVINDMMAETGLSSEQVDDLMWGCAQQRSEQGNNMARIIALLSDLGETVPGTTINRWCASSAQAVISAADAIRAGQRDCVIAGGVENMSRVKMGANNEINPRMNEDYNLAALSMGMTAEEVADRYDVSREAQDDFAYRSHERASEADQSGRFKKEIVPVDNGETTVTNDQGIRHDIDREKLSQLPTVFKSDGSVTPGNASQITDGAAALMITSRAFAETNDLDILAEVGNNTVAGVEPEVMGVGPVPACRELFERSGTTAEDYGLVELNEAFASQCLYCRDELGFDEDIYNVNGGAIALGHPLGATGARLPVTIIHEMNERGVDRGLATECVGFGQGAAIEFTLPN
jgi:acetyl-CoA acetyltransferase family protein